MKTIRMGMGLLALTMGVAANACALPQDDASRFSQAIPQGKDVAMAVPGSNAGGGASAQAHAMSLHTLGNPPPSGSYAQWYVWTRDIADSVDWGTGAILAEVWIIVHLPPTSTSTKQAVWGPGQGDALDPVVWRMTVDEIGTDEYDYKLEGRPKASTSEADYKAVLSGHGYGASRPEHKMGSFTIDQDAFNALDPVRAHDSGTVAVKFDGRAYPMTIAAEVKHTADATWWSPTVTHDQDGSGSVDITAHADISDAHDGNLEDVIVHSRWNKSGAGRADIDVSGGDLASTVNGSECWSPSYSLTYYSDTVNYKPTQGDAASCVYDQSAF